MRCSIAFITLLFAMAMGAPVIERAIVADENDPKHLVGHFADHLGTVAEIYENTLTNAAADLTDPNPKKRAGNPVGNSVIAVANEALRAGHAGQDVGDGVHAFGDEAHRFLSNEGDALNNGGNL